MSCILPSAIKPVADKYGVGVNDIMTATYLYQVKYGLERYDENDPKYDTFIKDYFKIDKVFDVENENQFKKIIKIWNNTDNGIIKLTNPENKIAVVSVLAEAIGANNVAYFTNPEDNVCIRIAQPTLIKSATDNVGSFSREDDNIYADTAESYEDVMIPSFDINDVPASMLESMDKAIEEQKRRDETQSSDPNLNEKFGNKTEITVNEILNNLLASNSPFAEFIKTLLPTLGELGNIQIELVSDSTMNTKSPGAAGVYIPSENKIYREVHAGVL